VLLDTGLRLISNVTGNSGICLALRVDTNSDSETLLTRSHLGVTNAVLIPACPSPCIKAFVTLSF